MVYLPSHWRTLYPLGQWANVKDLNYFWTRENKYYRKKQVWEKMYIGIRYIFLLSMQLKLYFSSYYKSPIIFIRTPKIGISISKLVTMYHWGTKKVSIKIFKNVGFRCDSTGVKRGRTLDSKVYLLLKSSYSSGERKTI